MEGAQGSGSTGEMLTFDLEDQRTPLDEAIFPPLRNSVNGFFAVIAKNSIYFFALTAAILTPLPASGMRTGLSEPIPWSK